MRDFNLNIKSTLYYPMRNFPEREIVYRNEERISFGEFYHRIRRIAWGLMSIGVRQGDTVAVIDWDTLTYLEAYYAVPMIGATLHTVNIRYPPETMLYTMDHAGDRYVILNEEFLSLIMGNMEKLKNINYFIVKGRNYDGRGFKNIVDYDSLLKNSDEYDFPEIDENTRATIFYTSGTTGMPKGVTFTHRNIVLHAISLALSLTREPLNLRDDDTFLGLVPFFHAHSWVFPYVALMLGNKLVLPGRYDMEKILEIMKKEEVTVSYMVPSVLYMLLSTPRIEDYADFLKGLKVIIGGAALPLGLARRARDLGIKTIGTYGLSEAGPVVTVSYHNKKIREADENYRWELENAPGIPLPLMHLRVVDRDCRDIPWDGRSIGEIVIRSPWLTSEYYKDPERTEKLWECGWMHTGDLATVDPLGYIHIVDREKDAIKSGGEFIQSLLLESIISEIPGIGEVAVVGRPDPKWGERPVAFVTLKSRVEKEKIYKHLKRYVEMGKIQKWWIPDDIIFIDSMPKTSTNKIDKKELRKI
ncbi:MAG TPA: fatty-acid--CoA ligase, partial [Euryarchaeota archaeon]|nr:fatty-acid--CoA ligase [Euryarchaeota archaeon]